VGDQGRFKDMAVTGSGNRKDKHKNKPLVLEMNLKPFPGKFPHRKVRWGRHFSSATTACDHS
jgi:hypothetical protein